MEEIYENILCKIKLVFGFKMDKSTKKLVVQQIEVYLTKYPTATVKDIKKFIFSGSQAAVNIDTV